MTELLSEVALVVGVKEEASWQKEKIEGVLQFPPINHPGGGSLLQGCRSWPAAAPAGLLGREAVVNQGPFPRKARTSHQLSPQGKGQASSFQNSRLGQVLMAVSSPFFPGRPGTWENRVSCSQA